MAITPVLPSGDARIELPKALRRFREQGLTAEPLIFGSHRRPEAVVIPFDLYQALLPAIEEIEIAAVMRDRGSDAPRPLAELAAELGLDASDYR